MASVHRQQNANIQHFRIKGSFQATTQFQFLHDYCSTPVKKQSP